MKNKVRVQINTHSIIDVITNSSTELFCGVFSEKKLDEIKEFIEAILGRKVEVCDWDGNFLGFDIERGDVDDVVSDFVKMLEKLLTDKFGEENFKIRTDVCY